MNILFTICGRAGSKGIKNKNIKEFLGFPLPFYTVSVIELFIKLNPNIHCDVVLNTDSQDLINLFKEHVLLTIDVIERDAALARDNTPKIAVIQNCLKIMHQRKNIEYDMVIDLDITSPLRTVQDVNNLVNKKMISNADIVFSVTDSRRNPYFNMVKKTDNGYERVIDSNFNSRQETPEIYDMNASLYAYDQSFLMSGKAIFEGKCDVIKMLDTAVLDLDHKIDFEFMQVIANHLFKNYPEFREVRENIKQCCKFDKGNRGNAL
jgi:CMP-N,N'-diacetyllegionaminic acid synthase